MTKSNTQIIPFPLAPYLASFFVSQASTTVLDFYGKNVKPFSIDRSSSFGKFIYRCLSKTNRKIFSKDGCTFFIEVLENSAQKDKFSEKARHSFLELKDEEVKEITEVFKSVFETALFNYVAGSRSAFLKHTNKKRGYLKAAILEFCTLHGLNYTDRNLMAWEQAINRAIKKSSLLKTRML